MKLHFISGLPRSGSTLLAGLLRQNPRFHAAMTGPVLPMVQALLNTFTAANETAVFLDEERRRAILRAAVDAYYCQSALNRGPVAKSVHLIRPRSAFSP